MDEYIKKADAVRIASGYCHPANVSKELGKLPPADVIPFEIIAELEQMDYELYCRTGKSHLNDRQWEWLKGVIREKGEDYD